MLPLHLEYNPPSSACLTRSRHPRSPHRPHTIHTSLISVPRTVRVLSCLGAKLLPLFRALGQPYCTWRVPLVAGPSRSSVFSSDTPSWGALPVLFHSTLFIAFMAHVLNCIYRFICWIVYLIIVCECHGGRDYIHLFTVSSQCLAQHLASRCDSIFIH